MTLLRDKWLWLNSSAAVALRRPEEIPMRIGEIQEIGERVIEVPKIEPRREPERHAEPNPSRAPARE